MASAKRYARTMVLIIMKFKMKEGEEKRQAKRREALLA
jgi:hypothetical protein